MGLFDILQRLEEALPILGGLTGHPELAALANGLINLAEAEIAKRMADTGQTRAEVLAGAAKDYATARDVNQKLKNMGHEED